MCLNSAVWGGRVSVSVRECVSTQVYVGRLHANTCTFICERKRLSTKQTAVSVARYWHAAWDREGESRFCL